MKRSLRLIAAGSISLSIWFGSDCSAQQPSSTKYDSDSIQTAGAVLAERPSEAARRFSALAPTQVPDAAGAAAAASPTLFGFLGFEGMCEKMGEHKEKLANTPLGQMIHQQLTGPFKDLLGVGDTVLPVDAPANLESPDSLIKAGAEVKAQEDAVPQKIAAIEYLMSVPNACCYDGVIAALIEGLSDCNEEVRYMSAKALGEICCCKEQVIEALKPIVEKTNKLGHYIEPSARVRAAALATIQKCSGMIPPKEEEGGEVPDESGETPGTLPTTSFRNNGGSVWHLSLFSNRSTVAPLTGRVSPVAMTEAMPEPVLLEATQSEATQGELQTSAISQVVKKQQMAPAIVEGVAPVRVSTAKVSTPMDLPIKGRVYAVDSKNGLVTVTHKKDVILPVGTMIEVYHRYLFGRRVEFLGTLEVVKPGYGKCEAKPMEDLKISKIRRGDEVVLSLE